MSSGFPPVPVYPTGYDSDFTLFQVYNTSETVTVADTDAFSEEIPIRPQPGDKPELWGDNGYATIAGELFYYDAVDKNDEDRICRLRRCVRNLGGKETQYNSAGTWVRGFVVAEHHNQLAKAILLIENFVGENFSLLPATLDWRIRHLADAPIISDDFACPNIEFDFNILSSNSTTGTLASFNITVQGPPAKFLLQFGDGQSTSTVKSGTHTYAPGATIDPVVIFTNDSCQIIQTPNTRTNPQTPQVTVVAPPFVVPVPIPPPIPPIIIPSIIIPPPQITIPPVVFPCFTPPGFPSIVIPPINIPSQINITPVHIPSQILIHPPINIPSQIIGPNIQVPSQITFENPPNFPNMIPIGPAPPMPPIQVQPPQIPPIQIQPGEITGPNLPSVIVIEAPNLSSIPIIAALQNTTLTLSHDLQNGISLIHGNMKLEHNLPESLKVDSIPKLEFDSGSIRRVMKSFAHSFGEALRVNMPNFNDMKMPSIQVDWTGMPTLKAVLTVQTPKKGQDLEALRANNIEPEYENVAFPDQIPISVPEIPPIRVKHNIPESIALNMPQKKLAIDASSVPTEIRLLPPREGLQISVVPFTMPKLQFDTTSLQGLSIPVSFPDEMPVLKVDFTDMPTLKVEFPTEMPTLKVEIPENTRIPIFYDGDPLPVQVNLKIQDLAGEAADNVQCVAIMPCKR